MSLRAPTAEEEAALAAGLAWETSDGAIVMGTNPGNGAVFALPPLADVGILASVITPENLAAQAAADAANLARVNSPAAQLRRGLLRVFAFPASLLYKPLQALAPRFFSNDNMGAAVLVNVIAWAGIALAAWMLLRKRQ